MTNITDIKPKQTWIRKQGTSLADEAFNEIMEEFHQLSPEQQNSYIKLLNTGKELANKAENLKKIKWKSRRFRTKTGQRVQSPPGSGNGLEQESGFAFVYFPGLKEWAQSVFKNPITLEIINEISRKDAEQSITRKVSNSTDDISKKTTQNKQPIIQKNYVNATSLKDMEDYIKSEYGVTASSKPEAVEEGLSLVKPKPANQEPPSKYPPEALRFIQNKIKELRKWDFVSSSSSNIEPIIYYYVPISVLASVYKIILENKSYLSILEEMSNQNNQGKVNLWQLEYFIKNGPPLQNTIYNDPFVIKYRHKVILSIMGVEPDSLREPEIAPVIQLPFGKKAVTESKLFLLEEMSKEEVRQLVKSELDKLLKDMIKDELEKVLKSNKDIKNEIGDISKDILKKLYKDLSLHHTYVIDRVKL